MRFFFGGGLGFQNLQYHTNLNLGTLSTQSGPIPSTITLNSFYVTLGVGFNWKVGPRILLGGDFGMIVPFASFGSVTMDSKSAAGTSLQAASEAAFGYFGQFILPRITILRLGYIL